MSSYKLAVKSLYKTLLYMGRDHPLGYEYFRKRCHDAFAKNSIETDPAKIRHMIRHGKFIVKELEALYKLKKYRTLKKRYYPDDAKNYENFVNKINDQSTIEPRNNRN